jgi:D-lyxose ketol-isomerase
MKKRILVTLALALLISACCPKGKKQNDSCTTSAGCGAKPQADSEKSCCPKTCLAFKNEDFYQNGKFNEDAAKDAILKLMKFYNYPIAEKTRSQLWVSDYGTGRFTELGLAAIMYANDTADRYMLQDMFLLPNQMLPEHWHEKPAGNLPAKMEGWLVRNGSSYIAGVGEDNLASFPAIKIPESHTGGVTVKHVVKALPGDFVPLSKVFSHHWQFGGEAGAIITEVANVHVNQAVRHQVKAINDYFLN